MDRQAAQPPPAARETRAREPTAVPQAGRSEVGEVCGCGAMRAGLKGVGAVDPAPAFTRAGGSREPTRNLRFLVTTQAPQRSEERSNSLTGGVSDGTFVFLLSAVFTVRIDENQLR